VPFLCIVVDLHVSRNNTELLNVAIQMQHWISFALFSVYNMIRTVVNIMYLRVHVMCPIFLSDFIQILIFSTDILRVSVSNITKIHPMRAALMRAERWTERWTGGRKDRKT
jgi:uncharacterized protein with PQ loop repeat